MKAINETPLFGSKALSHLYQHIRAEAEKEILRLKNNAGVNALRAITVPYHADEANYAKAKLNAQRMQDDVNVELGRAEGLEICLQHSLVPEGELTLAQILEQLTKPCDLLEIRFREEAIKAGIDAASYSEGHPEYGCKRAAALKAYGRQSAPSMLQSISGPAIGAILKDYLTN